MKTIQTLTIALTCVLLCLTTNSCTDSISNFLDKAPGVDVNENTIFSSRQQLDYFLTSIYKYGLNSNLAYRDASLSTTGTIAATDVVHPSSDMSDESDASEAPFIAANTWNSAQILPSNIVSKEDYRFYTRYIALRQIALVIKRIGDVPDITDTYKSQVIGEVKSIRALNYLEMVKRYGGVQIIDKLYDPGVPVNIPRNSIEECVNFIVKDCDDAIASALPATQSATLSGRIIRMVPFAIKARALLYAASPLFNTGTPYLPMADPANNKFVCYGNTDNNRWKLAANAAKAALDEAASSGASSLVDDPAKRNPAYPDNGTPPVPGNYQNSWEVYNNPEIILAFQGFPRASLTNTPWALICPKKTGAFWSGLSVTLNFLKKYEKLDGTPQTWDAAGGTDLIGKYKQLDPRFKQSISYTGAYFNSENPIMELFAGGKHYPDCVGGNWMRKMIQTRITPGVAAEVNDIILRLNEVYLNYAEALNESDGPTADAYAAINKIRTRSGMPNLPTGLSKEQFRARVRNERAIEMAFDDHRFWDIRRWLIAEQDGVMMGNMDGLKITKVGTNYSWTPYTFEVRTFTRNMYLHPFPLTEALKGNLPQNPGW